MKTETEIRAQLAELKAARVQAETTLNAIANQEWSLLWLLGELPEQTQAPEPPSNEPVITPPAELEGAHNGHRTSRRR